MAVYILVPGYVKDKYYVSPGVNDSRLRLLKWQPGFPVIYASRHVENPSEQKLFDSWTGQVVAHKDYCEKPVFCEKYQQLADIFTFFG